MNEIKRSSFIHTLGQQTKLKITEHKVLKFQGKMTGDILSEEKIHGYQTPTGAQAIVSPS